jgi:hypothetical protein
MQAACPASPDGPSVFTPSAQMIRHPICETEGTEYVQSFSLFLEYQAGNPVEKPIDDAIVRKNSIFPPSAEAGLKQDGASKTRKSAQGKRHPRARRQRRWRLRHGEHRTPAAMLSPGARKEPFQIEGMNQP